MKGIFTPGVYIWSKSVNEFAGIFPPCFVCHANQNLSTRSRVRAVNGSLDTNHMVLCRRRKESFFSSGICHIVQYGPASPHNRGNHLGHICSKDKRAKCHLFSEIQGNILWAVLLHANKEYMHSAGGYGGWFTPAMRNARCTWVALRLDHTKEELNQSLFVSGPRPRLQGGLCLDVLTVSEVDCCIDTSPNEPYWRGSCSRVVFFVFFFWCANTLRLKGIIQIFSLVVNSYTNMAQYNYTWPANNT